MKLPYDYDEKEAFEKGFGDYYRDHIVPIGLEHEATRDKQRDLHIYRIGVACLASISGIFLLLMSGFFAKAGRKAGDFIIAIAMVCWWAIVRRPRTQYFTAVKQDILPLILQFFGVQSYQAKGAIDKEAYVRHGLDSTVIQKTRAEDVICFEKDGVQIQLAEKTAWDFNKNTGDLFITMTFQQPFKATLAIISKEYFVFDSGWAARRGRVKRIIRDMKRVNDYAERHKLQFDIYSNNAEQAKLWLNEHFFQELRELNDVFDKKGMMCSMRDNQLFVQIHTHCDLFEVANSYNNAIANAYDIRRLLKEVDFTLKMTDMIKRRAEILHGSHELQSAPLS